MSTSHRDPITITTEENHNRIEENHNNEEGMTTQMKNINKKMTDSKLLSIDTNLREERRILGEEEISHVEATIQETRRQDQEITKIEDQTKIEETIETETKREQHKAAKEETIEAKITIETPAMLSMSLRMPDN